MTQETPSKPAKTLRSAVVTAGRQSRPGARDLRATGLDDAAIANPLIAVVHTWSRSRRATCTCATSPSTCARGVRDGGGTPIEFNTIAVTDGIAMGTPGMRASLASREMIADSIELAVQRPLPRRRGAAVGCDKTIPAAAMALARLDIPDCVLYGGTIMPGRHRRGKRHHHPGRVRSRRRARRRHDRRRRAQGDRMRRLPRRRRLRRPVHRQHDGDGADLPRPVADGRERHPRDPPRQGRRRRALRRASSWNWSQRRAQRARASSPRESLRNAAHAVSASGGSTNAVLHLLAIAHEAGVAFGLEDFDAACARTPVIADLKPGGRYLAPEMFARRRHAPGGARLTKRPAARRLRHRHRPIAVRGSSTRRVETPGQQRGARLSPRRSSRAAASRSSTATSRRKAASSSSPATASMHFEGPARVFDSEEAAFAAVQARRDPRRRRRRDPLRRPGRRTRHARDAGGHRGASTGPGLNDVALITDGRFSGATLRLHGRPRRARSRARRPASRSCATATASRIDVAARRIDVDADLSRRARAQPHRAARTPAACWRSTRALVAFRLAGRGHHARILADRRTIARARAQTSEALLR